MSRDLVNELEWLANAVFTGRLRLPYDDASYLREEDLYDFAKANGLDTARLHYLIEQALLVPQRSGGRGRLYNACSIADTMEFVEKMERLGLSPDMQRTIVHEMARWEENLWKETLANYRKAHPAARARSLADARLRVAATVSVVDSVHKEREWVLSGSSEDPAREQQMKRYFSAAAARKRKRAARIEELNRLYGGD